MKNLLQTFGKPLFLTIYYSLNFLIYLISLIGKSARVTTTKLIFDELTGFLKNLQKIKIGKNTNFVAKLTKKIRAKKDVSIPQLTLPKLPRIEISTAWPAMPANIDFRTEKILHYSLKFIYLHTPRLKFSKKAFFGILFLIVAGTAFTFWAVIIKDLPKASELKERKVEISTKIYDRNGVLLYNIYKDQNRTPVSLSEVPNHVRAATLAAEDAEFYNHPGISLRGIVRSIFKNVTEGERMGGSTITQQLVKNALLSPEKTLTRKLKEAILSIQVELTYSKDEILEMYLNEVSYGGTAFGIEEASTVYFGKDVQKLTLSEAALLAGLPKSPTRYSPFGATPELAVERQHEVLRLMVENGFITAEERSKSEAEKIVFAPNRIAIKAPHFVMYIKDQLAQKYGEEMLETGGLTVTTTLDYNIQQMAEKTVAKQIEGLKRYRVGNAGVVVMDPKTGEILAMVGSKDYFDSAANGQVNVTTSPRQPGSSIKPIMYAYALSHGVTPSTMIADTPTKFIIPGQPPYIPKNYDNKWRGNITIRSALAESRNIPAVKLINNFGVDKLIELGRSMGITTWKDPSQYGLSLTLGGGETKLVELARTYATIANMGERPPLNSILTVKDSKNRIIQSACIECTEKVLDPGVAFLLIDILKDNGARSPAFGSHSALVIPRHPEVAVKTGTSNDLKDNLTVGFNQKYLTAVWVGNFDGSPMSAVTSGVTGAAPIWNEIMRTLLAKEESVAWAPPPGVISTSVCPLTGTRACSGCPNRTEWFLTGTEPKFACNPTVINRIIEEKREDIVTNHN